MDSTIPHIDQRGAYDIFLIDGSQNDWQDLIPADLIVWLNSIKLCFLM